MKDYITSDRTLQVGDIVISTYNKSTLLYRITNIERRFLEAFDMQYSDTYEDATIGDEYNPIVTIESVANLDAKPSNKKLRKIKQELDADYLVKITPQYMETYIKRMKALVKELWP